MPRPTTLRERPPSIGTDVLEPLRIVASASAQQTPTDAAGASVLEIDMHRRICRIEKLLELVPLILAQVVDPTHLSIEGAARALRVSEKTIRRRVAAGSLTLDIIPGTRCSGIPVTQLYDQWIDLRTAKKAYERECTGGENKRNVAI